jgi:hypothetical protein
MPPRRYVQADNVLLRVNDLAPRRSFDAIERPVRSILTPIS